MVRQYEGSCIGQRNYKLRNEASERARRIIQIVVASKGLFSEKVIEGFISTFSQLKDQNWHQIFKKNYKIYETEEGKSRKPREEILTRTMTGKKENGEFDLRTRKGKEIEERMKTGLKRNGSPDLRTIKGKEKVNRAENGLKHDGTPDLGTNIGKQLIQRETLKTAKNKENAKENICQRTQSAVSTIKIKFQREEERQNTKPENLERQKIQAELRRLEQPERQRFEQQEKKREKEQQQRAPAKKVEKNNSKELKPKKGE